MGGEFGNERLKARWGRERGEWCQHLGNVRISQDEGGHAPGSHDGRRRYHLRNATLGEEGLFTGGIECCTWSVAFVKARATALRCNGLVTGLGLPPAVRPAEVGHTQILERPADVEGQLRRVLPVVLDLEDDVPAIDRGPDLRLGEQLGEPAQHGGSLPLAGRPLAGRFCRPSVRGFGSWLFLSRRSSAAAWRAAPFRGARNDPRRG
jgi:hypothetical protein